MKKHRSGGGEGEINRNEEVEIEVSRKNNLCIANHLPTDLIYKIFCRVQSKFIVQCKLVCRSWYNIMSSPDFMRHYAKNTPFTTLVLSQYQHQQILANSTTERFTLSFVEISDDENGVDIDCTQTIIRPKLPFFPTPYSLVSMMGSYNGQLCLLYQDRTLEVIYIYNPTSGETIPLPKDTFLLENKPRRVSQLGLVYAFGLSLSANEFKVLKITEAIIDDEEIVYRCDIFTVGVDTKWRQLEHSFRVEFDDCRIAFNGDVCWLARDHFYSSTTSTTTYNIAAFDFGEEKLGHISPPPGLLLNRMTMNLTVLNHRIGLLDYTIQSHYTLWTMEQYKVPDSWTKIVISRSGFPPNEAFLWDSPVAMLPNGNILLPLTSAKSRVLCYSSKKEKFTVSDLPDSKGYIYYISEFAPLASCHQNMLLQ